MTITNKTVKLGTEYRKIAHLSFPVSFGKWVTMAEFFSGNPDNPGSVYFLYRHGSGEKMQRIAREYYFGLLERYYIPVGTTTYTLPQ